MCLALKSLTQRALMILGPLLQLKISISESDILLGDSRRKEVTNEGMEE